MSQALFIRLVGKDALVCATGVLYVYAYLPETKGKSLDQIEALFDHAHL